MNTLKRRYEFQVLVLLLFVGFCGKGLQAASWLPFGPNGGDARAFAADPRDSSHLYLGTANGWIYESRQGGAEWHRLAKIGKRDDLALDNIIVDASDTKHILAAAFELGSPHGGLYVSRDGGATWTSNPEMKGQSIRALTASASDSKTLVAGTLKGVYRSTDGGRTLAAHQSGRQPGDTRGGIDCHRSEISGNHLCGNVASAMEDDGRGRALAQHQAGDYR